MEITINEKQIEVGDNTNIEQLLVRLDKPLKGTAIAVNQYVISRSQWGEHLLCDGDEISLFQAIAGG